MHTPIKIIKNIVGAQYILDILLGDRHLVLKLPTFTFYRQDLNPAASSLALRLLDKPLNFNKIQDSHWRNNRKIALYLVGQLGN